MSRLGRTKESIAQVDIAVDCPKFLREGRLIGSLTRTTSYRLTWIDGQRAKTRKRDRQGTGPDDAVVSAAELAVLQSEKRG
jgi:hypothetical protein